MELSEIKDQLLDFLFCELFANPVNVTMPRKLVKRAGEAANLTRLVTPHMLRHTAATQLLEHGVDIRFVQKLLGHQSIGTTEGYTSVSDASLKLTIMEARKRMEII
jgi:site-specific recombinase XerD